jgi:hypothetical protein
VIVENERPIWISDFEVGEFAAVWGRYGVCHVVLLR